MRIGIFTLPLHTNYGGILQAYALQTLLEEMGHEVKVINKEQRFRPMPRWKRPLSMAKRTLKKLLVDPHTVVDIDGRRRREFPLVRQHTDRFIRERIHSYMVDMPADVREGDFDAIVVGSDQIWRPMYFGDCWTTDYPQAFLSFARDWDIKRYGYGISFGVDEWEFPEESIPEFADLAQKFILLSFREDTGVELCRRYLHKDAVHVLDPTMVVSLEHYMKLIKESGVPKSNGSLFYYILDTDADKRGLIDRVAREQGLQPFTVFAKSAREGGSLEERIVPPVEKWLRAFTDAEFVVTDSFHGCVFSIIFGKPFVAIGNVERGLSRMESLMKMFGLEEHLLTCVSDYDPSRSYEQPEAVRDKLSDLRRKSWNYLRQIK